MPERFATIVDAPLTLEDGADGQPARSRIPVAMLGTFKDSRRYGRFSITADMLANWKKLLTGHFHGQIPIDEDHKTDKGISSKARGWIKSLSDPDENKIVWADVEWTPEGEKLVRDREFAYISPTFVDNWKDDQERPLGPALLRAALSNSPFLHRMPAISLSTRADEQVAMTLDALDDFALVVPEPDEGGADSRGAMSLTAIAKALGLDDSADEAKILETIAARPTPLDGGDTKTLEQQAAESGKVLLDAAQVADLTAKANAGEAAAVQLKTQRFEDAFARALDRVAVDATDETRQLYTALYEADQDSTVKLLDSLKPIANAKPKGAGGHDPDLQLTTQIDGKTLDVDPDMAKLMHRAEQIAAEKGGDAVDIALQLASQEVTV